MRIIVKSEGGRVKGYWQFILLGFLLYTLHFTLHTSRLYSATPTAEFLRINPSASASSMGGAYVGYSGKIDSIYSNPSGLATIKSPQLSTTYISYIQDVKTAALSYAKPVGSNVFGISVLYFGLAGLEVYDKGGIKQDKTASANNFLVGFSWAKMTTLLSRDDLESGISLKGINQKYDDASSNGVCIDAGVIYKLDKFSSGISLQNFGPEIDNRKLPSTIRAGTVYRFPQIPVNLSLEVEKPIYSNLKFKTGAEYEITSSVNLRSGYEYIREAGALSGISFGLGLKTLWQQENYTGDEKEGEGKKIGVSMDYAFSYFGDLGNIHKVSFGLEF